MTSEPALEQLNRLASWTTDVTHPSFPGVVLLGTATIEWLEGEHFLMHRARIERNLIDEYQLPLNPVVLGEGLE